MRRSASFKCLACAVGFALLLGSSQAAADVSIGRADGDGADSQPAFINRAGVGDAGDVAIDGDRIFWIAGNSIGRANLDGSNVDPDFITGLGSVRGLSAGGGYVYWGGSTIGRARVNGTDVDPKFMTPSGGAADVAAGPPYLYWASDVGIGRAGLDGSSPDPKFIDTGVTATSTSAGLTRPSALAVNDSRVFWVDDDLSDPYGSNFGRRRIASANSDGSGAIHTIAQSTGERGDYYFSLAADQNRLYAVVDSGLADQAIASFDQGSGASLGAFATSSELDGGAYAQGLAASNGKVYWSHLADRELHCDLDYSHYRQRQSGRAVRVALWLAACERVSADLWGRLRIGRRTYALKSKTLMIDGTDGPESIGLRARREDRGRIRSALKRGQVATARLWLRATDDSGNSSILEYGARLRRADRG